MSGQANAVSDLERAEHQDGAKKSLIFGYDDANSQHVQIAVDSSGRLDIAEGLVPENYDYISLGYTGDNLTSVVYKLGGSGGDTVATLTLAYTGDDLTSVTKT